MSSRILQAIFLCVVLIANMPIESSGTELKVGFYQKTCPSAETVIRKVVSKYVSKNPGLAAGLIRLHFHDCFVRGCDASVLLKSTKGKKAERDHKANNPSLRGFEVIDEAKAKLESICPETVSCADILAFASRDSARQVGGINYAVPAGRRDGRVSEQNDVTGNLPAPFLNATQLIQLFAKKGLSADEMVTLSGAHSIGVSHCSAFSNRLYSFNKTYDQDPSLDPEYAKWLKTKCPPPQSSSKNPTVALDVLTPNYLDNKYYVQLKYGRGLLISDQTLFDSSVTEEVVLDNARDGAKWAAKFVKAMVHMGYIDVITGYGGEIRKYCSYVN